MVDNVWIRKDLVILKLDTLTVYTSSDNGKELKMPVTGTGNRWEVMSMSLPFLFTFKAKGSRTCIVQVFKVPTDIGTDISLLKSINIEIGGFSSRLNLKPFSSTLVVGVRYSR